MDARGDRCQLRAMIIGLDCAEPSLVLERWRDELPTLSGLMERGPYGAPDLGDPADHRPRLDLHDVQPHTRRPRASTASATAPTTPTTTSSSPTARRSTSRASGTWRRATGKPSIVVGVPGTYPPRPLNGDMVSCFLTPSRREPVHLSAAARREVEAGRWRVPLRLHELPHRRQGRPAAPGLRDDRPALPARRPPARDEALGPLRDGRDRASTACTTASGRTWTSSTTATSRTGLRQRDPRLPTPRRWADRQVARARRRRHRRARRLRPRREADGRRHPHQRVAAARGLLATAREPRRRRRYADVGVDWARRPPGARAATTADLPEREGPRAGGDVEPADYERVRDELAGQLAGDPRTPGGEPTRHARLQARGGLRGGRTASRPT